MRICYVCMYEDKVINVANYYSLTSLLGVGRVTVCEAVKSSGLTKPPRKSRKRKGIWGSPRSVVQVVLVLVLPKDLWSFSNRPSSSFKMSPSSPGGKLEDFFKTLLLWI